MIAVDHVSKTYGGSFTAVDDVTFTARPGRVTGFLGPNGAGTTTLRVVVGLTPPDQGTAHVLGRRFQDLPNPGLEVGVLLASAQHAGRTTGAKRAAALAPAARDRGRRRRPFPAAGRGRPHPPSHQLRFSAGMDGDVGPSAFRVDQSHHLRPHPDIATDTAPSGPPHRCR